MQATTGRMAWVYGLGMDSVSPMPMDRDGGKRAAGGRMHTPRIYTLGSIYLDDRAQRLLAGLSLMGLNVYAMQGGAHWNHWVALVIQVDLLLTAVIGWCPVTFACRVATRKAGK